MGKTREGETVTIYPSSLRSPYGELIQGVDPSGKAKFILSESDGKIKSSVSMGDSSSIDSFSRQRVSLASYVFDGQLTYDLQPLLYEQIITGSGASIAHDTTNRMALMTFNATPTGGKTYMQTFEHFRYTPGRSQLIFITFNFIESKANCLKSVGYSTGTNGIEFQNDGINNRFVLYSLTNNGNDIINQADWNLDALNGSGPSGYALDITKTQILVIDLQALYVGRVRIGFDIGGIIVYAHEFLHSNVVTTPYIQTANLPIRAGMSCTGTVSTTMNYICSSVIKEDGNVSFEGYHFTMGSGEITAKNTRTHAISIRPKTTFNSISNRIRFEIEDVDIMVTGNTPIRWELVLGQAITGGSWADINTAYSGFEYNATGSVSGDPAIVMTGGYVAASNQSKGADHASIPMKYPICLDAVGSVRANGTITLLFTSLGADTASHGRMCWKEIR